MNWKDLARGYDADTFGILEIAVHFLVYFFGHTHDDADKVMYSFLLAHSSTYDKDTIHHESAYRIAAIAHYLIGLRGALEDVGTWMIESGNNQPPVEASAYFRDHYYKDRKANPYLPGR